MRKIFKNLILSFFILFNVNTFAATSSIDKTSTYDFSVKQSQTSSIKVKRLALILSQGIIAAVFAYIPVWLLVFSSLKNLSAAPMNEHYHRIAQSEPLSFFARSFIILCISYSLYYLLMAILDSFVFTDYAPMSDIVREFWEIEQVNATGRYANIIKNFISAIISSRMIIESLAFITSLIILFASFIFVFTYFGNFSTDKGKTGLAISSGVSIIIFILVSMLYDSIATNILNSGVTALDTGREFIQAGIKEVAGQDIF